MLGKVGGGAPGHSAAWSLHVAGQSGSHKQHLGENDQVADVIMVELYQLNISHWV